MLLRWLLKYIGFLHKRVYTYARIYAIPPFSLYFPHLVVPPSVFYFLCSHYFPSLICSSLSLSPASCEIPPLAICLCMYRSQWVPVGLAECWCKWPCESARATLPRRKEVEEKRRVVEEEEGSGHGHVDVAAWKLYVTYWTRCEMW